MKLSLPLCSKRDQPLEGLMSTDISSLVTACEMRQVQTMTMHSLNWDILGENEYGSSTISAQNIVP
jgi:hypothetical protein